MSFKMGFECSTLFFVLLTIVTFNVGRVIGSLQCHNCISKTDDMTSCQPITPEKLGLALRDIEGPQFKVETFDPDVCVKLRLDAVLDRSEVIVRTQVRLNAETKRAIFKDGLAPVFPHCRPMFVNSFINKKGVEVNVNACLCDNDHCNYGSTISASLKFISIFLISLYLFS